MTITVMVKHHHHKQDKCSSMVHNQAVNSEETVHPRIKLDELGFEILDTIFSYFSTPGLGSNINDGGYSHYENQLNLLNFCHVSRAFYNVAR